MKASKFHRIYCNKNETNLKGLRGKKGIYLIKENGKLVYIGHSKTDLYKTITRHFQKWRDSQRRVTYHNKLNRNTYTIRIVMGIRSEQKILDLEKALIRKHKPRDNEYKYDLFKDRDPQINLVKGEYERAVSDEEWIHPSKIIEAPF